MIVLTPSGAKTLEVNFKKLSMFSERGAFNEIPLISLLVEQENAINNNKKVVIFLIFYTSLIMSETIKLLPPIKIRSSFLDSSQQH